MSLTTTDKAKKAAFYKEADKFLRMDYCDADSFTCHDEDTGEEYTVPYNDATGTFLELVEITDAKE